MNEIIIGKEIDKCLNGIEFITWDLSWDNDDVKMTGGLLKYSNFLHENSKFNYKGMVRFRIFYGFRLVYRSYVPYSYPDKMFTDILFMGINGVENLSLIIKKIVKGELILI